MKAKTLSIFTQMVQVAQNQKLEYKVLYSYHQRNVTNGYTEAYRLLLCTNLFAVYFEENFIPENTSAIKGFLQHNKDSCIKLDFDIKTNINTNNIELCDFR